MLGGPGWVLRFFGLAVGQGLLTLRCRLAPRSRGFGSYCVPAPGRFPGVLPHFRPVPLSVLSGFPIVGFLSRLRFKRKVCHSWWHPAWVVGPTSSGPHQPSDWGKFCVHGAALMRFNVIPDRTRPGPSPHVVSKHFGSLSSGWIRSATQGTMRRGKRRTAAEKLKMTL